MRQLLRHVRRSGAGRAGYFSDLIRGFHTNLIFNLWVIREEIQWSWEVSASFHNRNTPGSGAELSLPIEGQGGGAEEVLPLGRAAAGAAGGFSSLAGAALRVATIRVDSPARWR